MKILDVKSLSIDSIRVLRFGRFCDDRGYFTEQYRRSDFQNHPDMDFMKGIEFLQCNESFSRAGTIRGLHFQWNPYMGKLVRTIAGRMVDLVLDVRKGSPSYGKLIGYDMPANRDGDADEWIWVPPGFAHGNVFAEDTVIEYMCSGEYSQGCEAGISPLANDIDWSLCEPSLKKLFDETVGDATITDKDRDGLSLADWGADPRSENFIFDQLASD